MATSVTACSKTWAATNPSAALDRPDRIVFDLDLDADLPLSAVRGAAYQLYALLHGLGLPSAAMLSGGFVAAPATW